MILWTVENRSENPLTVDLTQLLGPSLDMLGTDGSPMHRLEPQGAVVAASSAAPIEVHDAAMRMATTMGVPFGKAGLWVHDVGNYAPPEE